MIFASLDENKRPVRFYDKDIFGDNIPADAVHIPDDMWHFALSNPGEVAYDGEAFVRVAPAPVLQNESALRANRNRLLLTSDWLLLPDSPASDEEKQEWKAYRQKLRDLPSTDGWPNEVVWPAKPSNRNA